MKTIRVLTGLLRNERTFFLLFNGGREKISRCSGKELMKSDIYEQILIFTSKDITKIRSMSTEVLIRYLQDLASGARKNTLAQNNFSRGSRPNRDILFQPEMNGEWP